MPYFLGAAPSRKETELSLLFPKQFFFNCFILIGGLVLTPINKRLSGILLFFFFPCFINSSLRSQLYGCLLQHGGIIEGKSLNQGAWRTHGRPQRPWQSDRCAMRC